MFLPRYKLICVGVIIALCISLIFEPLVNLIANTFVNSLNKCRNLKNWSWPIFDFISWLKRKKANSVIFQNCQLFSKNIFFRFLGIFGFYFSKRLKLMSLSVGQSALWMGLHQHQRHCQHYDTLQRRFLKSGISYGEFLIFCIMNAIY